MGTFLERYNISRNALPTSLPWLFRFHRSIDVKSSVLMLLAMTKGRKGLLFFMCAVVLFAPVCLRALWGQYAFNRGAKPKSTALAVTAINSAGTISLGAGTSLSLGQSAQITLTLSVPAPEAGVTVILTSSDASIVTVTPSSFIPGGRTSLTFSQW